MMSSGFVLDTSPLTYNNIQPCFEYIEKEIGKVDSSFTMMKIKCSQLYEFAFQISLDNKNEKKPSKNIHQYF